MTPASSSSSAYAAAVKIITRLREQGYTALLAGGCVRDQVLGLLPKDFDVATDAPPQVVQGLFVRTQAVGEAFGVVLVHQGKISTEVATFRKEWGYHDGRRPDHVQFTDAKNDVLRRDFTINGLLADPLPETSNHDDPAWQVVKVNDGRSLHVLDYVDGLRDLRDGVLRAIGPAEERFAEDYLRMLRAVRFASRFGFTIESRTAAAIRAHARYLGQISRERIGAELRAMLTGPRPAQSLTLLEQLNLDGPTLHEDHRQSNLKRVQALTELLRDDALANPNIPWMTWLMAWVLDRHLPLEETQVADVAALRIAVEHWLATAGNQQLRRLGKALVLTNDDLQLWRDGFKVLPLALGWNELRMAAKKRALASPGWSIAWVLTQTMTHACPSLQHWQSQVEQEISELCKDGLAPIPLVNGDDLIALGRKPGPVFRRLLEQAYDLQLEGQLQSRTQALDWLASQ